MYPHKVDIFFLRMRQYGIRSALEKPPIAFALKFQIFDTITSQI